MRRAEVKVCFQSLEQGIAENRHSLVCRASREMAEDALWSVRVPVSSLLIFSVMVTPTDLHSEI